jgi:peptide/nickel transport system substrate-binding protein
MSRKYEQRVRCRRLPPIVAWLRTWGLAEASSASEQTVRVCTKVPDPLLLQNLSAVAIMSRAAAEGHASADFAHGGGIGSGPFRFVEWIPANRVVRARNDHYSGTKPYWAKVTIRPLTSNAARTAALLSGDVDVIEEVPTADIGRLRADPRFTIVSGVSTRLLYLQPDAAQAVSPHIKGPNGEKLDHNPLRDLPVRQAISKAVNRKALVERTMDGQAVAAGQFLPDGFFGTSRTLKISSPTIRRALAPC